jgi:hypothetical protein
MVGHNSWRVWQLINDLGLRSNEAIRLIRDAQEEFPMHLIAKQIKNLEKLGFEAAAGLKIGNITPTPDLHSGISKACLPAYLVIPEQVVPLAKQCEILKIDLQLDFYDISNAYETRYPERPYWIFQAEIHGAGPTFKNCRISDLEKVGRCGATLIEGLAVLRENPQLLEMIRSEHEIAFPGSRCGTNNESVPSLRLPCKSLESIREGREILLYRSIDVNKEMEEYLGDSDWSKTMIISRAQKIFRSGAYRGKHPNR